MTSNLSNLLIVIIALLVYLLYIFFCTYLLIFMLIPLKKIPSLNFIPFSSDVICKGLWTTAYPHIQGYEYTYMQVSAQVNTYSFLT